MDKTIREAPPQALLLRAAIPDWPATLTNGELLSLARRWRVLASQCEADRAAIGAWAVDGVLVLPQAGGAASGPPREASR